MKFPRLRYAVSLLAIVATVVFFASTASATPLGAVRFDGGTGGVTVGINFHRLDATSRWLRLEPLL
jgi:hypothetical protein